MMTNLLNPRPTPPAVTLLAALLLAASAAILAPAAHAQGSRKDDIVLGPTGHPVPGATVTVCQATATGTPCSPLATIYTDATLTVAAPNPLKTDGLGNYHFYAPSGRYVIQISGPTITGTLTYRDVILAPDSSTLSSGSNISAFSLALGGDLSVAGNATINGTLTSSSFNPGTLAPSSIQVAGNGCFAGPRPYLDVTCPPYNAKGDASTDDTTAIQAAITAACASTIGGQTDIPEIYFPPGYYLVSQPQTPSTSPIFTISCPLKLVGGGGTHPQFTTSAVATIGVSGGASPNAAAAFLLNNPSAVVAGVTIDHLLIDGYNQAVSIVNGSNIEIDDSTLRAKVTGQADNTPLRISSVLWFWMKGGVLGFNNSNPANFKNLYDAMFIGENGTGSGAANIDYLIHFEDITGFGGAFEYDQRAAISGGLPTNFTFRNISIEDSANSFFTITSTTGNPTTIPAISLDHARIEDPLNTGAKGVLEVAGGMTASGVWVSQSGAPGPAILQTSGSVNFAHIEGCSGNCSNTATDASGNLIGGASVTNAGGGLDVTGYGSPATRSASWLRSDPLGDALGPPFRATPAGSYFSTLAIDPTLGDLFSDGASYGYTARLLQSTPQTLDIGFAQTLPPTNIAATPTTGGTLAAGTYYYYAVSTQGSGCDPTVSLASTMSLASNSAVLSGSNNAVGLTWTPPAGSINAISGYCVIRTTSPFFPGSSAQLSAIWLAGSGTTSVTDLGSNFGSGPWQASPVTRYMTSVHRFTPTSLGIGTLNPQFNLDVNGTAAVNALNSVQKAERFSGADAAAKINACLTAASTSSGLCDARGFTGTITATSHIQIPAATTLLWGRAQLTINDTTNNDAVELLGDGSTLIGYQESGSGTVPRPDSSGFIACQPAGCTTVKNPNAATRNVDWVHITGMNLQATGSGSKVLNLTSVSHADIENNRFIMGTGGSSYGIFGDTSTGGFDSTNTLIKHNEFDPQYQNDRCLRLAGVFNVIELEQNTCILPASNTGTVCFEIAKDSNNNYPNNDEFYGNDCEGSSTSFGQIGYNIINADSITIGPNNRCENVYNCFQFPVDGSAVGIHVLDPYISVSANSVVKPNEPSTSQIAIDNNGPNWLPSMHFGINDLAGRNLLGNAAFEGWQNATTLYYWGGASGTNINQAGSGIYAQNTSAGSPADSTTQGTYNVKIGDNATAGLGVNSGCIQVDATMNYTLAFRIAAASTGINFRPGFRFYSDPNCTDANKITNVATNARVLAPANYAGESALIGTGTNPNWQSSNASLTYNNGITCNCNVTGADWHVAAASTWPATRNFAVTFRVPNAYSSSTTVARSMRVFILENTAANPNQIYVDDVVLSEGPINPSVPFTAPLSDSGNPSVYGNLTVAGNLTVGASALPATLTSGTPVAGNCAAFTSGTVTNIQDSGSPCPTPFTKFAMGFLSSGQSPSANNAVNVSVIYLPNIQFSKLTVDVSTTDASGSDFYSWAITDPSGAVKCSVTAVNLTAGGANDQSCTQGTVTLPSGPYIFAFTGNATTAKIAYSGTAPLALSSATSSSTSSSGAMTFPITIPAAGVTYSGYGLPAVILH
jgi:Pectate lyase superfamily protein